MLSFRHRRLQVIAAGVWIGRTSGNTARQVDGFVRNSAGRRPTPTCSISIGAAPVTRRKVRGWRPSGHPMHTSTEQVEEKRET